MVVIEDAREKGKPMQRPEAHGRNQKIGHDFAKPQPFKFTV